MNDEDILDGNFPEVESKKIFKFQIIEFVLIALFCSLLWFRPSLALSKLETPIILFHFAILLFLAVRIFFEYKNQLITGFGIVLKIYLLINAAVILIGVMFVILNWEFASEMMVVALTSFSYPYFIYAFTLKKVSIPIKLSLAFSSIGLAVLTMGILFRLESWSMGQELGLIGFLLTLISLAVLIVILLKMKVTNKEQYHSINYIARSLAVLFFGFSYLF